MGAKIQDGGVGRMEVREILVKKDIIHGRKFQGKQRREEGK